MSIVQLWRMIRARKTIILSLIAAGAILAAILAQVLPDSYTARSRIVLKVAEPDPVTGETVPGRNLQAFAQTMSELVHDDQVAANAAQMMGWQSSPELRAAYASQGDGAGASFPVWLGKIVSSNTSAKLLSNSNIFEISYSADNPDAARQGANAVRSAFIERTAATRRAEAERNARFFGQQSDELKRKLTDAEQRKAEFEKANNIVLQDDNQDTDSAKLKALAATPPPLATTVSAPAAASAPSAGALASVDAQIASMQQTLGPNHPQMIALQRQRAALASAVGREQAASRTGGPRTVGPSLQSLVDAQTRKVLASRGLVGQAQTLAGEVTVLRDQLTKTRQKAADFQLEAQTSETGLEPIGEAVAPMSPDSPGTWLFVLIGLALGAALGVGIGLGLEILFRRVRGQEDIAFDGIPVLGSMANWQRGDLTEENLYEKIGLPGRPEPAR